MIELTEAQAKALDAPQQPPVVVDPLTGQHYRLIKEEIFKLLQGIVKPFNRGWDNSEDDDLIRKDVGSEVNLYAASPGEEEQPRRSSAARRKGQQ